MQYAYGPVHVIITSLLLGLVTMAIVYYHGDIYSSVGRSGYIVFCAKLQVIDI